MCKLPCSNGSFRLTYSLKMKKEQNHNTAGLDNQQENKHQ